MSEAKPCSIAKQEVWEAYQKVKANHGAAGVDGQSIRARRKAESSVPWPANLFLHYAFDRRMAKQYPQLPFERFADDAIVHCRTEAEARRFGQP